MSGEEGWPAHSRGPVHSLLGAPARDCADEDGAWWGHVTPWNIWCSLLLPWQIDFRFLHGHLAGTQACAVLLVGSGPVVHLSLSSLEGFTSGAPMVLPCPWRHCCPSLQPSVIVTFGEKGFSAQGLTFPFLSQGPLHSFCKFAHPVSRNLQALHICGYSLPCTRIKFHFIRPLN